MQMNDFLLINSQNIIPRLHKKVMSQDPLQKIYPTLAKTCKNKFHENKIKLNWLKLLKKCHYGKILFRFQIRLNYFDHHAQQVVALKRLSVSSMRPLVGYEIPILKVSMHWHKRVHITQLHLRLSLSRCLTYLLHDVCEQNY